MLKRTIALLGSPIVTEEGEAAAAITPGYLVEGQTAIAVCTVDALKTPIRVALERDELGDDIDVAYAIGDTVKVGAFHAGQRFLGYIASGQTITADDLLESSGSGGTAGTFEALGGAEPLVRAVESVSAVAPGDTAIRLEVI